MPIYIFANVGGLRIYSHLIVQHAWAWCLVTLGMLYTFLSQNSEEYFGSRLKMMQGCGFLTDIPKIRAWLA